MNKALRNLLPILTLPTLALSNCNSSEKEAPSSRFTAHTFSVAGGMTVITQITDHELNKLYFYKLSDKNGLVLKNTIDITKAGDMNIPSEALNQGNADAIE